MCNLYLFIYCNQEREEKFRQMSEETNGNVLWWAIIQTSILLSVGIWQMKNLKNFLIWKEVGLAYEMTKLCVCITVTLFERFLINV